MKKYTVITRRKGTHRVLALTNRHAVACIVARLGLNEQQAAEVVRWVVVEEGEAEGA